MGVGTFTAYSIITYKTPWCIISIIWPLFFTFGAFILIVPRHVSFVSSIIASILLLVSFGYAISLNYFHCSSFIEANWDSNRPLTTNLREFFRSEPYVYVQTYNDIYKLTRPLLELAHADPQFYHLVGHILRPSPYPLPWILGDFPRKSATTSTTIIPPDLDADFLLVEESKIPEVEKQLQDSYFTEPLTVRPYQDPSKLYLRASVFQETSFPGDCRISSAPENNKASAMRLLSAGLIYVAVSTVAALLLGENAGGLNWSISFVSLIIGATGAIAAFFLMPPSPERSRRRS